MLSFLQTLSHKYKAAVPQILGCVGTPARQMTAANGGGCLNLGLFSQHCGMNLWNTNDVDNCSFLFTSCFTSAFFGCQVPCSYFSSYWYMLPVYISSPSEQCVKGCMWKWLTSKLPRRPGCCSHTHTPFLTRRQPGSAVASWHMT